MLSTGLRQGEGGGPGELEKGEQEDDFENKHEVGIDIGNMQRREW